MSAGPTRYRPCALCKGDGCAACDQAGFYLVGNEAPVAPKRTTVTGDRNARYLVCIARDGWAKDEASFLYPRWCVAASVDGKSAAFKYRNGGPEHLVKTTASKLAPDWMRALVAHVAGTGPLPLGDLVDLAESWKKARGMPRQAVLR